MHKSKTFEIKVVSKSADGGKIQITTGGVDRDKDRVLPLGGRLENYLKNSVVQWSHNYRDPFATIGRSDSLEVNADGIVASFTLRPAANEADPQNIVRLLWEGGWIKTASIGFNPIRMEPNDFGGLDFLEWELLEWSLTPIPANPNATVLGADSEVLRLAAKQFPVAYKAYETEIAKRGRVLSAKNEKDLAQARDLIDGVLAQLDEQDDDGDKAARQRRSKAEGGETGSDLAWVRRMEAISDLGTQQLFAVFYAYSIDVPKDATTLECDDDGELVEVPHPDAGKTIARKEVNFIPPLAYNSEKWGSDATYSISAADKSDDELVKGFGDEWEVTHLSEVLANIPAVKSSKRRRIYTTGVKVFTQRGLERAKAIIRRKLSQPPAAEIDDGEAEALLARLNNIHTIVNRN